MFLLVIGWTIVLAILMVLESIIGLVIGLGVLALALGYVNSYLAEAVWEMGTDDQLIPRFFHGVLLLIMLLIADIPVIALNYLFPHWLMSVILFLIYVPIHGFVGLKVAEIFEVGQYIEKDPAYWGD
jgi:hypothetical protein